MIQIIQNPDKDNSIYFSLISSILALYMDAPKLEQMKMIKKDEIHKDEIHKDEIHKDNIV
jgi:hypothetical protein